MTTIKEIADRLEISVSTVSKGLNGASDISEELRQLVLDTAVEMGYQTKRMKKDKYRKLCLFIKNMEYENPSDFGYDIILGFKQAAFKHNWNVDIIPITPTFETSEKYDTFMLKGGYSGAFFVGLSLHDSWLEQLRETTIPAILFDNYIEDNPYVSYIGTDNYEGIHAAIDHLYHLGHRKIAFLNGVSYSMISRSRRQAFLESMDAHDLSVHPELVVYGDFSAESARDHVPHFLSNGATAILCGSDVIASGVISECQRCGYRVPNDVSVIGFDDLPISATLQPLLTTIRQNRLDLGHTAFFSLSAMLEGVFLSRTLLHPELVVRASTAKRSK